MDILKAFVKIALVLLTIGVVGVGIFLGYQYAFPPVQQTSKLNLPSLDLNQCSSSTGGVDPTNLFYALQLSQHPDKLTTPPSTESKEATFTVESGELPTDIAVRLQRDGFITDSDLFLTLLKCRHASELIQAGDHVLRRNMTMDEVVVALEKGVARGVTITIPPGWRAEQIADYLSTLNLPQFNKADFLKQVEAGNFDFDFLKDRPKDADTTVEGYLYPETYSVLQGITDEQLINRFLTEFGKRITPDMRKKAKDENMTLYEVVTLASIVEREAVKPQEAPIIAGVYMNRINDQMFLDADPTVQYALGYDSKTKRWWPLIPLEQYAGVKSPYNTYIYTGLPPGPICEPGLNAIQAALEPTQSDYLYFLAKGDGTHVFAKTLEEQNANMAKYGYQVPVKP
ncbi:MAG: endolytic transglycosylase MltG [Rudaea sp.]